MRSADIFSPRFNQKQDLRPIRSLEDDRQVTEAVLKAG